LADCRRIIADRVHRINSAARELYALYDSTLVQLYQITDLLAEMAPVFVIVGHRPRFVAFGDPLEKCRRPQQRLHGLEIARDRVDVKQRIFPGLAKVAIRFNCERNGRLWVVEFRELLHCEFATPTTNAACAYSAVVVEQNRLSMLFALHIVAPGP